NSIKIVISNNKEITITKIDIKFEVFYKMVIHRKQFPLFLSYGITIHKNQGIICKNAMINLETSVFSDDQAYIDLSRMSILEGLHLINFNLVSVKANLVAIIEYNRLRFMFNVQLSQIHSSEKKAVKIHDCGLYLMSLMMYRIMVARNQKV
ncbi:PIF1 helicase, partial [Acromyrmex insinuator]